MTASEMIKEAATTPFINYAGVELTEISEGRAVGKIHFEEHHKNLHGGMHGGAAYTLADTVSGYAAMTYGQNVTTINASFNYMRPVMNTDNLICTATVTRHGKTISVVETRLTDDSGKLLITGCFTFFNIGDKK